jgi:plastocyanin domain-containing protein
MNPYLWIAIAASVGVIAAHGVLFWWFLCKKDKTGSKKEPEDP